MGRRGWASGGCRLAGNGRIVVVIIAREGWWQAIAADPELNLINPDVYLRSGAPHEQFSWLREQAPVFWHEDGGKPGWPGFWAVTRHEEVAYLSRHPEVLSSARRTANFREFPDQVVGRLRLMMLNMDPPQRTRQRG